MLYGSYVYRNIDISMTIGETLRGGLDDKGGD